MKKSLFIGILLFLLVLPLFVGAKGPTIQWDPKVVEQTIGNGGVVDSLWVTFTSSRNLEQVDLWVVPELQSMVKVEPNHFDTVIANEGYDVRVYFSIPPGMVTGLHEGTIHLRQGRKTISKPLPVRVTVEYGNIVIPESTRVLSESTTQYLYPVPEDKSKVTFAYPTPEVGALVPGDILVIGVTDKTPHGLLGKVTKVTMIGTKVEVDLTQATLEEAISGGTIDIEKKKLYDDDLEGIDLFDASVEIIEPAQERGRLQDTLGTQGRINIPIPSLSISHTLLNDPPV